MDSRYRYKSYPFGRVEHDDVHGVAGDLAVYDGEGVTRGQPHLQITAVHVARVNHRVLEPAQTDKTTNSYFPTQNQNIPLLERTTN